MGMSPHAWTGMGTVSPIRSWSWTWSAIRSAGASAQEGSYADRFDGSGRHDQPAFNHSARLDRPGRGNFEPLHGSNPMRGSFAAIRPARTCQPRDGLLGWGARSAKTGARRIGRRGARSDEELRP